MKILSRLLIAAFPLAPSAVFAAEPEIIEPEIVSTIEGNVNEPTKLTPTDELVATLSLPPGFSIQTFARLEAPRMLAFAPNGDLYVTRRAPHNDVVLLRDADRTGTAETVRTVASIEHVHGIALRDGRAYLAAIREVYAADVLGDGSLSDPIELYSDLPDAGQHPNRTLGFSPDGRLFLSVGSTNNAAPDPNPENATLLELALDGSSRSIHAHGLRNTIGFDWHPADGTLWGMDHGIDWLGDEEQSEELNIIIRGGHYGWPYVYDYREINQRQNPEETLGLTREQFAAISIPPVAGLEPHSAPMGFAFYNGAQFPTSYRHQAFLALHGSWNRAEPKGYKVVLVTFSSNGYGVAQDFVTGFYLPDSNAQFGRPCGLAIAPDGSLFFSDDSGGAIYRVTYRGSSP